MNLIALCEFLRGIASPMVVSSWKKKNSILFLTPFIPHPYFHTSSGQCGVMSWRIMVPNDATMIGYLEEYLKNEFPVLRLLLLVFCKSELHQQCWCVGHWQTCDLRSWIKKPQKPVYWCYSPIICRVWIMNQPECLILYSPVLWLKTLFYNVMQQC